MVFWLHQIPHMPAYAGGGGARAPRAPPLATRMVFMILNVDTRFEREPQTETPKKSQDSKLSAQILREFHENS